MTQSVLGQFALTPSVRASFRHFCEAKCVERYRKTHSLVFSEGRGHRFESCRVRQFSAIFERRHLRLVLGYVRVTFGCCFDVRETFYG
jgi:hypothetical protein